MGLILLLRILQRRKQRTCSKQSHMVSEWESQRLSADKLPPVLPHSTQHPAEHLRMPAQPLLPPHLRCGMPSPHVSLSSLQGPAQIPLLTSFPYNPLLLALSPTAFLFVRLCENPAGS